MKYNMKSSNWSWRYFKISTHKFIL